MSRADEFFDFTCFNTGDLDDPSVGLENGVVSIPGILLRREVFDPVVNKVQCPLNHIHKQLRNFLAGIRVHETAHERVGAWWHSSNYFSSGRFRRESILVLENQGCIIPLVLEKHVCLNSLLVRTAEL